jgi:hypothetical protein
MHELWPLGEVGDGDIVEDDVELANKPLEAMRLGPTRLLQEPE